jgi:heme A synthase
MKPHLPRAEPGALPLVTHRRLIGLLGILLPILLYALAGLRPTRGLPRWEVLDSVSAYYYTGAVGVFVGVLFALSLFLFTYPGYRGERADRWVGALGGAAALGVALFPTAAPGDLSEPSWWSDTTRIIHYVSAVTLFVSFILFALWLFRKSSIADQRNRPRAKQWRNRVYLACGVVMIFSVLWAGSALFTHAPIFLPEALAIVAFAVSWLVKGEAYGPFVRTVKSLRPSNRGG